MVKRVGIASGALVLLLIAVALGGFRLGFPSWIPLAPTPERPEPTETPAPTGPAVHCYAESLGLVTLRTHLTHAALARGGGGETYLVAELQAKEARARTRDRSSLNLALVIDRSGSMERDENMQRVKQAAKAIIEKLGERDRVCLVAYSTEAELLATSRPVEAKKALYEIIDDMDARGATNMSEGLELGAKEVLAHLDEDAMNRVLVLSDGKANMGVTDPGGLCSIVEAMADRGVSVSTLGVGKDFNEDLLVEMADIGRGNFHFIERSSQMVEIFEREVEGLLEAVAKEVDLVVTVPSSVRLERVYGWRWDKEGATASIPGGSLASGQTKKVVFRLRVTTEQEGPVEGINCHVRYTALLGKPKRMSQSTSVGLAITDDALAVESGRQRRALTLAEAAIAADGLERAVSELKRNNVVEARRILGQQVEETERRNTAYFKDRHLNVKIVEMKEILQSIDEDSLDGERRSIVVKQGRARSYEMAR